jgi:hypothetical protein
MLFGSEIGQKKECGDEKEEEEERPKIPEIYLSDFLKKIFILCISRAVFS